MVDQKQVDAQELADKAKHLVEKMNEAAFRSGWAKGYEKGFAAGVEAMGLVEPQKKVQLTDA